MVQKVTGSASDVQNPERRYSTQGPPPQSFHGVAHPLCPPVLFFDVVGPLVVILLKDLRRTAIRTHRRNTIPSSPGELDWNTWGRA